MRYVFGAGQVSGVASSPGVPNGGASSPSFGRTRGPTDACRSGCGLVVGGDPLGQGLEQLPGDLGMPLDEAPEVPGAEGEAAQIGLRPDGRGAGNVAEETDLAEEVPRPELRHDVAVAYNRGLTVDQDEEGEDARAALPLSHDRRAALEPELVHLVGEPCPLGLLERREERDPREGLSAVDRHGAMLLGPSRDDLGRRGDLLVQEAALREVEVDRAFVRTKLERRAARRVPELRSARGHV